MTGTSHTAGSHSSIRKKGPHAGEHAPGPWTATPRLLEEWEVTTSDSYNVASVYGYCGKGAPSSPEANARLIAASPDLLSILQEIIAACDVCGKDDDLSLVDTFTQEMEDRARAAISKATGEAER